MGRDQTFELFKVLADKTRYDIAVTLSDRPEGSCAYLSSMFPDLSQSTLSHHFKILAEASVISVRKEGTAHYYSLNKKILAKAGITL